MATAFVTGATGHAGSYMVPALIDAGYEVTAISRGNKKPYTADMPQWKKVNMVTSTRDDAIELIASSHPDVIVDLIAYTVEDMQKLCEALYAAGDYEKTRLIFTGSVWVIDKKYYTPYDEEHPRTATDPYGTGKAAIAEYLHEQYMEKGLRYTVLHPGHICGKGWIPIGPTANKNTQFIRNIMEGKETVLPDNANASLAHVHSADIAALAIACLNNDASIDEEFFSTCDPAITLYGYTTELYRHFGQEPDIRFVPYNEFLDSLSPTDRKFSEEHIRRSPSVSMSKAERLLGFTPRYSDLDTVLEAIDSIADDLDSARP